MKQLTKIKNILTGIAEINGKKYQATFTKNKKRIYLPNYKTWVNWYPDIAK